MPYDKSVGHMPPATVPILGRNAQKVTLSLNYDIVTFLVSVLLDAKLLKGY